MLAAQEAVAKGGQFYKKNLLNCINEGRHKHKRLSLKTNF